MRVKEPRLCTRQGNATTSKAAGSPHGWTLTLKEPPNEWLGAFYSSQQEVSDAVECISNHDKSGVLGCSHDMAA